MIPTYFHTSNNKERFMNIITFLITHTKPPVLMKPGLTSFNYPTINTQPTHLPHIFPFSFSQGKDMPSDLCLFSSLTDNAGLTGI